VEKYPIEMTIKEANKNIEIEKHREEIEKEKERIRRLRKWLQ